MFTFNQSDFWLGWVCAVLLGLCAVALVGCLLFLLCDWVWCRWLAWWLASVAARAGHPLLAVRLLAGLPATPGRGVCSCGLLFDHTSRHTVVCFCGAHHPPVYYQQF